MNIFLHKKSCLRVQAVIMAILLIITMFPNPSITVRAATPVIQKGVTIRVIDIDGQAVSGATVSYIIEKKKGISGGDTFASITNSKLTDDDGVVEILDSSAFIDGCLVVTAYVEKEGYELVTGSLFKTDIENDTQKFTYVVGKKILDIENVEIKALQSSYDGTLQELVSVSTSTEDVVIEYSTDNVTWSSEIPKKQDAGEYSVYIRIFKNGYNTYESGEVRARINKADINLDMEPNTLTYMENVQQSLVTIKGDFAENDVVTWTVNGKVKDSKDIPQENSAGMYSVKLEVNRGENYNIFSKEVMVQIYKATLDISDLQIQALDGIYTGQDQNVITEIYNPHNYSLQYQMDDGSQRPNNLHWQLEIPKVKDAGTYIVWVKAVKENYEDANVEVKPAVNAVAPYNVYIDKAEQELHFKDDKYNKNASNADAPEMLTSTELEKGKIYDFGTDHENVIYTVEFENMGRQIASIDSETGILIVTGAGKIVVKATLPQTSNYKEKVLQYDLYVSAKKTYEGEYVTFSNQRIEYTVGNKLGVPQNKAEHTNTFDMGRITYSMESATSTGLSINKNTGIINIQDYRKLINAVEKENGCLDIEVEAHKEAGRSIWNWNYYPGDSASYILSIQLADIPAEPCRLYSTEDRENALLEPNGDDNWYNSTIVVVPTDGYDIIRSETMQGSNPVFASNVILGEILEGAAADQGINESRAVYLRDRVSGEITPKIILDVKKLDNVRPYGITIDFPERCTQEDVWYYDGKITITFTAYDATSGVKEFLWKYEKEEGVSQSILASDEGAVEATADPLDGTKYTGTLTLPENQADQLRGRLSVCAVDNAGNKSDSYEDSGVFVIDTIAPTQTVKYQMRTSEGTTQLVDGKRYFSDEVEFVFDITEANFYPEDVFVGVSIDGGPIQKQDLIWADTSELDGHEAELILSVDAEYVISMEYKDRSGGKMTSYQSETIVIDREKPVIEFLYNDYLDSESPQTAVLSITEHNFRASDIDVKVNAHDIAGRAVPYEDLQTYLRTCEWTDNGDMHTAIIGDQFVDAIYELTFNYRDLALNEAQKVETDTFIVDRTAPGIEDMSIDYSEPLLESILSKVTLGFYNPNVTVTFMAHDKVSGIKTFIWGYEKETDASAINVSRYEETKLEAVQDVSDRTKYTASVKLPKNVAEQLRGNVTFYTIDNCKNISNKLTDSNHVIVVDTIAPTMQVEYTTADNLYGDKEYYNRSLTATFKITEANFYKEDVHVILKKNDKDVVDVSPDWIRGLNDEYIGVYTIDALPDHSNDGDYVFVVEYTDRSKNKMSTYTSGVKVIDTTAPVIKVNYTNNNPVCTLTDIEGHYRKYFSATNTATVVVTERNFNPDDVKFTIIATDVAGKQLNTNALYTKSMWTKRGEDNVLTITYPGNANYTFDVDYTDLAKLAAADYNTDYFTVDTQKPTDLKISYSTSVLDTVLSAITFGFYNAKATVTISATDNISGIQTMKYSYIKADGVSDVNTQLVDVVVDESHITKSNGNSVGTVTFEIPRDVLGVNNQFNGTIHFSVTDRAKNESDILKDSKRIVVDNIAPTATVEYSAPVQQLDGVSYYAGDVNATVIINEANFYSEDVKFSIIKDDNIVPVGVHWSTGNADTHIGTFTLSGDGDYFVNITYSDKSRNIMQEYKSNQITIDTDISDVTITVNGQEANGKAFKGEVIPTVSFEDKNFESCEVKMFRTRYKDKDVDVTEQFVAGHITTTATGGSGTFDSFDKIAENDGIYTITAKIKDKAGHTAETSVTFTVNRFGSVYEYSDYLISLTQDGGAYVQRVEDDLVIIEYNADRLVTNSLSIEISRDGRPLENSQYTVTPEISDYTSIGSSGWYQYTYTISKDNFVSDGVYKVAVSSEDATGNSPENSNYDDKEILFRVDSTAPEITSVSGLEENIINATEQEVKYVVYDTIGLKSVVVYINGKEVDCITDFTGDVNNYAGKFTLKESSSGQRVRLVVTDLAGNVTDTDANDFESLYAFSNLVTVSTNVFVRWFANKIVFVSSIIGVIFAITGIITIVILARRKNTRNVG